MCSECQVHHQTEQDVRGIRRLTLQKASTHRLGRGRRRSPVERKGKRLEAVSVMPFQDVVEMR